MATGRFALTSSASANVIAQAYWGALFCFPVGFSFTALRLSTLVLGGLGILALYLLLRELGIHASNTDHAVQTGISALNSAATVHNTGKIVSYDYAVNLKEGGLVINSGTIDSTGTNYGGVEIQNAQNIQNVVGTVENMSHGSIDGINLLVQGTVLNAGGSILNFTKPSS